MRRFHVGHRRILPCIINFFPLDYLFHVQYNKSRLDDSNYIRQTCSFIWPTLQKEVQFERIYVSSADNR